MKTNFGHWKYWAPILQFCCCELCSITMLNCYHTEKGYIYTENSSKNRQGGESQLKLKNKCFEILENEEAGDCCHCKLLDMYISKLPEEVKAKDLFYVRPLEEVKSDSTKPWYYCAPIGRNKLSKMVAEMCKLACILGHHSNHSLRATGATQLYTAGLPEKIIQERTGHRSVECLRSYGHTSEKQQHAVSRILSSSTELNFQTEMKLETHETHSFTKVCPTMSFNNCQVNINYNQGPSAQHTSVLNRYINSLEQTKHYYYSPHTELYSFIIVMYC